MADLTPADDIPDFCQADGCLDLWTTKRGEGIQLCERHAGNVDRVMEHRQALLESTSAAEQQIIRQSEDTT